jgi:N-acetylmuramoyl-L-alanine amidase
MRRDLASAARVLLPAALLLAAALACAPAPARAETIHAAFTSAWHDFHDLCKDSRRGQYRSYWQELDKRFSRVYRRDPDGSYAPKALFFVGRVNEELGKRSFLRSDFQRAADYYHRVYTRFPGHSWTDDALYRRAVVQWEHLHDAVRARAVLNTQLAEYPKGDMWAKARDLLREVIKETGGTATASRAAPKPAPKAENPDPPKAIRTHAEAPRGLTLLNEVRHRSSDEYTRVVLDLGDEVPYRYQILDPDPEHGKPHRLYVDMEGAVLGQKVQPEVRIADGILRRVRIGQFKPEVARVVLDFQDLQKYQIFALENPYRIVVDVSAPDQSVRVASLDSSKGSAPRSPSRSTAEEKPSEYKLDAQSKRNVGELVEQLGLTIRTIMIDPGHGGKDPGAVGRGNMYEKHVNLRFAKILGRKLEEQGFEVLYTREDDTFIPLEERTALANVRKADLFISVHCNAHTSSKLNGLETYYLDLATTKDAVRVAARENAVSAKRISDLQFILTDLMLNSKMKESKDLANSVHSRIVESVSQKYSIKDYGVRTAPFYVLMGAKMPSILVELGYITNPTEAKRMQSDSYLARKADGLVRGVLAYKHEIERFASL